MKKLIPLLIVGMFILIGFGAVATPTKQITNPQPNLVLDFYGGLGVKVVFRNIGNETIQDFHWDIIIDTNYFNKVTQSTLNLEPGDWSIVKCFTFGFGSVYITVNVDNMNEERQGFLFGPFVFLEK